MKLATIRKLVVLADVALAALVVWAAVGVLRAPASTTGDADAPGGAPSASPPSAEPLEEEQVRAIVERGTIVQPPEPEPEPEPQPGPEPEPEPIDVTKNFRYRLIGTAVEESSSFAFFEDDGGRQTVKSEGEELANARIVEIEPGRVLIEINGRRGHLEMARRESSSAYPGPAQPPSSGRRSPPAPARTGRAGPEPPEAAAAPERAGGAEGEDVAAAGELEAEVADDAFEDEIEAMIMTDDEFRSYLQNVGKYVGELVILSHYDDEGNQNGLLLSKVPKSSEAYRRGFRQGDIVKSLQGAPVTDLQTALRTAYRILEEEDYLVDVTIVRDGGEETLSYEIWPE